MTAKATIAALTKKLDTVTSEMATMVNEQVSTMRRNMGTLLGLSHEGKRDVYKIYGYPETLGSTGGFQTMYRYSRREGIANRLTWGVAKTCWRDGFDVYASSEDDADQILINELNALKKAGLNKKIESADILNRIGRMAVLFVGVPDGGQPEDPISKVAGNPDALLDKLYFVPYAYDGIEIASQVSDLSDPRYGLPEFYNLSRLGRGDTDKDTQVKSIKAHWSRIIHLNENALDSDIEGMGALEPIFNRILDIDKACGGSAEAYFRNAKGKIAFEIDPQFASSALTKGSDGKTALQEGAEKFTNEYQDWIATAGGKVKGIDTPHDSPLDTVKVNLWGISGYSGYPLRVLTGEGSGQLAGSEDQLAVNQITRDRQRGPCTGWLDRFFEILQAAGMLKNLPEGYEIRFPVQEAATEKQKAENGSKKADTVLKLVQAKTQPGGDGLDLKDSFAACVLEDIKIYEPDPDDLVNPDKPKDPKKVVDNED